MKKINATIFFICFISCTQPGESTKIISDSTASMNDSTSAQNHVTNKIKSGRAFDAVVWGMPMVNFAAMYEAMTRDAGGQYNQIVYWSKPLNWKNQTLTPNTEALYFMPFFNTEKTGPIVLEIPAAEGGSITGTIMDCWQTALEDVGPAGVDKGKGGKYLILPPDYKQKIPAGYIVIPSQNYEGYALLRSIPKSLTDSDISKAVIYAKKIRIFPLSETDKSPETIFIDAFDKNFDSTIPYNLHFFELLSNMIQSEPWITRDRVMINSLKGIGIEKGKTFNPDEKTKQLLHAACMEAKQWLADGYEKNYPPFYQGKHWFLPYDKDLSEALNNGYPNPDAYPIDSRAILYYCAYSSVKHPGAGQFYLFDSRDNEGKPLEGNKTYKLTVPAHVPVHQYWSVTAYDFETHALIRDVTIPDRSSLAADLKKNPDGSVDIYFASKAPDGKESNWVSTKSGEKFELIFRLYGPDKSFFTKTWVLNDLEIVK